MPRISIWPGLADRRRHFTRQCDIEVPIQDRAPRPFIERHRAQRQDATTQRQREQQAVKQSHEEDTRHPRYKGELTQHRPVITKRGYREYIRRGRHEVQKRNQQPKHDSQMQYYRHRALQPSTGIRLNSRQSLGGAQGGGVASLHRPERGSGCPTPLASSSGGLVKQPDIIQVAKSTVIISFTNQLPKLGGVYPHIQFSLGICMYSFRGRESKGCPAPTCSTTLKTVRAASSGSSCVI